MQIRIPIYYRYISHEFLLSFFVCFVFFFFIFFANQILLLAEHILSKKIPVIDVFLLLIYFIPAMISLSFPFASLVGCLMSVSRLSSDNEILSMQSSGISHRQMFIPLLVIGIALTLFSFVINDYFLPVGTMNYTKLYKKLIYSNPELELESFSAKKYMDTVLITGLVSGKQIDDILIVDRTTEGNKRFISAEKAVIGEDTEGRGIISLTLDNVFSHYPDQKKEFDYNYFTAEKMVYNILISDFSLSVRNPGPREMSSYDVYQSILEKETMLNDRTRTQKYENIFNYFEYTNYLIELSSLEMIPERKAAAREQLERYYQSFTRIDREPPFDRTLQIYRLEFHKKFALPAACIFFVFFSYPAGLFSKKSGKSVGFGIGLIVSVFYWCMLFAGHTLGIRSNVSPVVAMWFPDIIIMLFAGLLSFVRYAK